MKNVLWITGTWPPARCSIGRQYKLAKYLPEYGWNPIVLAYGNSNFDPWVDNTPLKDLEHLEVHRTKAGDSKILQETIPIYLRKLSINTNWWSAPDLLIRWKSHAIKEARKIIRDNKIDTVFSTVLPYTCHLVGLELKKEFGIPWVADYRDFWTLTDKSYSHKTQEQVRQEEKIEEAVLQEANWITIVNDVALEMLRNRFPFIKDKSSCITHGYDPEDYKDLDKTVDGETCHITYAGSLYGEMTNGAKYFLYALKAFYREKPTAKLKVGFIGNCKAIQATVLDLGLCNGRVAFTSWSPRQYVIEAMAKSDILLLILGNSLLDKHASPGKLYDYLGIGKPILAVIPDGVTSKILEETGGAIIVKPNDIEGITQAIGIASKTKSIERTEVGQYDIHNKTQEMADVLEKICQ